MSSAAPATDRIGYLLAELQCASLRARLMQADIDAIGLALQRGMISPEQAVALLDDVQVLRLIDPAKAPT